MKIKPTLSKVGNGLLTGLVATGTVLHNSPLQQRIDEIDEELERLQKERDELESRLIKDD